MTRDERVELSAALTRVQEILDGLLDKIVELPKDQVEARRDLLVSISADCAKAKKSAKKTKAGK